MRIVVHDYPGHAFPVQLSRQLARQGHEVWHVWSADIEAPRGPLSRQPDDPPSFRLCPLSLGRPLPKYKLIRRFYEERRYAAAFCRMIEGWKPDVVLSNPSPFIQGPLLRWCRHRKVRFVNWLQDIYYLPIQDILSRKFGPAGRIIAWIIRGYEIGILRRSDHVVVIADAFHDFLVQQNISPEMISVIPNWAILDEMPEGQKINDWSREQGLADSFVYLYAGTLGLKHNPKVLADLALGQPDAKVVVISQGLGRRYLEEQAVSRNIPNLVLMDYQPFESLPEVLASADVFVALLEPSAGGFSVPSKILTYLCAGRPILGAIPLANAAAQTIVQAGAGLVVRPEDIKAFLKAAQCLRRQEDTVSMGRAGRLYAERMFDIEKIGSRFLSVFRAA